MTLNSLKITALNPNAKMLLFLFFSKKEDTAKEVVYGNCDPWVSAKPFPGSLSGGRLAKPLEEDRTVVVAKGGQKVEVSTLHLFLLQGDKVVWRLVKNEVGIHLFKDGSKLRFPRGTYGTVAEIRDTLQGDLLKFSPIAIAFFIKAKRQIFEDKGGVYSVLVGGAEQESHARQKMD